MKPGEDRDDRQRSEIVATVRTRPNVLSEVKLDAEDAPRPENELPDFKLSSEVRRSMCQLDQLKDGKIERIEV
jgi:hypothetical protein